MGEHKIPGASLGPDYKEQQHAMDRHTVVVYSPSRYKPGQHFKMQDGQRYGVTKNGNFVRIKQSDIS